MRYLICFSYDGSKYNGYQKQPNKPSIQEEIEKVLTRINSNKLVTISASGRTDSKVHAYNQTAHFDLDIKINVDKLKSSLNKLLPESIYIKNLKVVDDNFHARFDAIKKDYLYKINLGTYNPIEVNYVYQYGKILDINKMLEASKYFIGSHDFTSFTKGNLIKESFIRDIYNITILECNNILTIKISGNGFLRYMVRNIVGCLVDAGSGKIPLSKVKEILDSKDRKKAGITMPACGLYLDKVYYEDDSIYEV